MERKGNLPTCPNCGPRAIVIRDGCIRCVRCNQKLGRTYRPVLHIHGFGWTA